MRLQEQGKLEQARKDLGGVFESTLCFLLEIALLKNIKNGREWGTVPRDLMFWRYRFWSFLWMIWVWHRVYLHTIGSFDLGNFLLLIWWAGGYFIFNPCGQINNVCATSVFRLYTWSFPSIVDNEFERSDECVNI